MKRNCNLELRLYQPPPPQQLTIFYHGQIAVCDVTELQARAIISEASKRMDQERYKRGNGGQEEKAYGTASSWDPISPTSTLESPSPSSGMSMKKSLERFLQKRKHRQLANSPYGGNGR